MYLLLKKSQHDSRTTVDRSEFIIPLHSNL